MQLFDYAQPTYSFLLDNLRPNAYQVRDDKPFH